MYLMFTIEYLQYTTPSLLKLKCISAAISVSIVSFAREQHRMLVVALAFIIPRFKIGHRHSAFIIETFVYRVHDDDYESINTSLKSIQECSLERLRWCLGRYILQSSTILYI